MIDLRILIAVGILVSALGLTVYWLIRVERQELKIYKQLYEACMQREREKQKS